jgi:hypothetical protein
MPLPSVVFFALLFFFLSFFMGFALVPVSLFMSVADWPSDGAGVVEGVSAADTIPAKETATRALTIQDRTLFMVDLPSLLIQAKPKDSTLCGVLLVKVNVVLVRVEPHHVGYPALKCFSPPAKDVSFSVNCSGGLRIWLD